MRTDRPIRVGIFRDTERVRRAVLEARRLGFTKISVVADDPNIQASFRDLCDVRGGAGVHRTPGQVSAQGALLGAGIGLVLGFLGTWIFEKLYGTPGAILNVAIPLAGVVWGAFIGAMVSRSAQREPENFWDQELQPGEILVAIEDEDPARLALAEKLLRDAGVEAVPLSGG